ncbi:alpha-tocopherol transfer protein-like [Mytilus californianus]|uniref:alpha-tocopherol transfer protein-like n=1 Tax=Mytilus californianus TaxID=6549 RepID=UPI0022455FA5|nr:alpha-tocopherol transfer protein-like [Mytilus californianus]
MAENGNPEYVCTLSPELVKKAQEELNEKPEWRSRDIQALREMVEKEKALRIRTDDAFLLRFLRAKKFDYERAFNLIMTHFKMRIDSAELFEGLRPSAVKQVLEAGVTGVLPHRDKLGRRVIVLRPGKWNPSKFGINDVFRTNFLTMSRLIEDEETQINGLVMMMDLDGIGWAHAKSISPLYARKVMGLIQDAFPARFKGMHYFNEPTIFDYIFAIGKQFMKEKTVSRLHFHGNRYEELKEFIDEENIPEDYGGKGPKYSNKEWMDELLRLDAHFDNEAKYGLVDGKLKKPTMKEDAIDCMVGSYRKLDV